ncbi:MAG: tyrosine-type recombinase/integrase, partial [Chloroflexi bacterium]|nr:tyrosine-type recombinase/integrase [Chloroflexota bacterium]
FLSMLSSQKGFSDNTLSAYRGDLAQFANYLDESYGPARKAANVWSQVTRDTIIAYLLYLKERRYAPTTVARKQAAIKSFFKYLASKGVITSNPSGELASPHVERALPHTISSSEADRLISEMYAAKPTPEVLRDRAMMQVLYATGLRVGEMVALNLNDIDLKAGTLATGGRGKSRSVAINSQASSEATREYLQIGRPALAKSSEEGASLANESSGERALFLNHRGQRLTRQGFWLILKRYARSAGLGEITPHTLRHSFAAQKLHAGADMRDLQQILGHANISTTQVYARVGENNNRKVTRNNTQRGRKKAAS